MATSITPSQILNGAGGVVSVDADGSIHITAAGGQPISATATDVRINSGPIEQPGLTGISVSTAGEGRIYFDSTLKKWRVSEDSGAYSNLVVANPVNLKGSTDCSANPNYPAGSIGDMYYVSVAGKIGGASGKVVQAGDAFVCLTANAGGTQASVGSSWFILEQNQPVWSEITNTPTTLGGYGITDAAPIASPTFTGTVTIPTPFTLGATSVTSTGTEHNYLVGVTSAIQTQLSVKAASGANTDITSLNGPALGTPSSGVVTNLTGTASININGTVGATTPTTGAFTTLTNTGAATNSKSGAASTSALTLSGVPFAGTGTTSFPLVYINDANATASTTMSTSGTSLGVNAHTGIGNLIELMLDGASKFKIASNGDVTTNANIFASGSTLRLGAGTSTSFTNGNNTAEWYRFTSAYLGANTTGASFSVGTTGFFEWTNAASGIPGTIDTALYRNAAGVVEINNGTAGTFRDLKLQNIVQTAKTTTYNNIATVSNGVPSEIATIDSTGLTANVAASTLYAVPASGAGLYRVSAYLVTTTAASVSSTMPNAQVVYTDSDSNTSVTLDVSPILGAAGLGQSGLLTANAVGTVFSGTVVVYIKASTTIQYQTVNYASTAGGMAYALRMKLEAL